MGVFDKQLSFKELIASLLIGSGSGSGGGGGGGGDGGGVIVSMY